MRRLFPDENGSRLGVGENDVVTKSLPRHFIVDLTEAAVGTTTSLSMNIRPVAKFLAIL